MSNKAKSTFKAPYLGSHDSQKLLGEKPPGFKPPAVLSENDLSKTTSTKKPLTDIGNTNGVLKQKASKGTKNVGNKENVPAVHKSKKPVLEPNLHRERKEVSKGPTKPCRAMSNDEYEEIFASVIVANKCDTNSEASDIESEVLVLKESIEPAKTLKGPKRISTLSDGDYEDIFANVIYEGASSIDMGDIEMPMEFGENDDCVGSSTNEIAGSDSDTDCEGVLAAWEPTGSANSDGPKSPENTSRPPVMMRRHRSRIVSRINKRTKLVVPGVRRRLFAGDTESADDVTELPGPVSPPPVTEGADDQLQGQSCCKPPIVGQSLQSQPAATSQSDGSGAQFKLPSAHRSQGPSTSGGRSKSEIRGQRGSLKESTLNSTLVKKVMSKKRKSLSAQDDGQTMLPKFQSQKQRGHASSSNKKVHSQSSQRSESSQSQTLSQVHYQGSQPPAHLTAHEQLEWLQDRRDIGLWAVCDLCDKNRYLPDVKDPLELPNKWFCHMHPDPALNSCASVEVGPTLLEQEDLIHNDYTSGSLVWGRLDGYPWWPAMVDDCPDVACFYWLNDFSDIPTHYNVTFFDIESPTRAWLLPSQLIPFTGKEKGRIFKTVLYGVNFEARLKAAKAQAMEAMTLSLVERRRRFSFIARYKGKIGPLKNVSLIRIRKELAKMDKASQPRFTQRELMLLQQEVTSPSSDHDTSGVEQESHDSKKQIKKRKKSSTQIADSNVSKKPRVLKRFGEKSIKEKAVENFLFKKEKALKSKIGSLPKQGVQKETTFKGNKVFSVPLKSKAKESQDGPEMGNGMKTSKSGVRQTCVAARDEENDMGRATESAGDETFCDEAESATRKLSLKGPTCEDETQVSGGENTNLETMSGTPTQNGELSLSIIEDSQKSQDMPIQQSQPFLQSAIPCSDSSYSPSLDNDPSTGDHSRVLDYTHAGVFHSMSPSVAGSQVQDKLSAESQHITTEEFSENNEESGAWSELAVVPNSDPRASLDFSQELYDAVVPDFDPPSVQSEPFSSEADPV